MAPSRTTPKPKGTFRRIERVIVGAVMSMMAFVLEKAVMRSIKRDNGGTEPEASRADATSITTKGGEIDFEPER